VEIVCLRHAESENVLTGASGAVSGAPLTARGRAQAAGLDLAVDRAYASGAVRARQTAAALGVPVTVLPELAELGVGSRDGAIDAALRRETADALHAWVVTGDLDRRVADGESGHEILARMTAALTRIAGAGGRPAVVGHVGSLTLAVSVLCGLGGTVWGTPLPPAAPFPLRWDESRWHCPSWPAA
jgi:alpha-ribazole phosphatase/probable phosphoglycerate mutase